MLCVRSAAITAITLLCLALPAASSIGATKRSKAPAPPTVRSVAPMKAAIGDQLTIKGRNFLPGRKRNTVFFKVAGKRAVAARAERATRTTIKVTIPRSVEQYMTVKGGTRQATRLRLRVRAKRLGRSFTAGRRSPTIVPAKAPPVIAADNPCPAGDCAPPAVMSAAPSPGAAPAPLGALVFEDQFDGAAVDKTKWSPYTSSGHGGNGLRRPSAFTQENGQLVITAAWDGTNIVSGGMSHRYDQLYGSYEFRVRVDPDPSGQTSGVVLTWPLSGRSVPDGEMDIWETGHSAAGRNPWYTFIHLSQDGVTDKQVRLVHNSDAAQWHTIRMDWSRDAIRTYVDGVLDGQITDPARIPSTPHHLCVQLDAFSNNPLPAPVRMYVDWVKVYR